MTRLERVLLLAVALAVLAWDVWTVRSNGASWDFGREQRDYYNLLIDGWLDGQLSMKVDVPAELLAVKDPYDPQQRPPGLALHDATLYKGKYYLYFGAAPMVVLMLPFRVVTGVDLPLPVAELMFVYGAFLAAAGLWLRVRQRYFPETGTAVSGLALLVLGIASLGPVLLRRPHMWELPIGAGYCFSMLALWAVFEALHAERSRRRWYATAGLCLGLAIASRPTYLVSTPLMLVPLLWWWSQRRQVPWREAVAGVVPLAVVGALMALHNYLRFENPLQFGQAYQLSLDYESKMAHFGLGYVGFNGWRYFFSAAQWLEYFPFIQPAVLPPKPTGFGGHDDVFGVLTNLPVAWLALAAPLALWRRDAAERGPLLAWLGAVSLLFFAMAGMMLCFFGSLARYQLDFTPTLMLLASVGVLALERLAKMGWWLVRAAWRSLWGGLAVVSVVFAMLFSLQLNRHLAEWNPDGYRDVARWANTVPAAWQWIKGERPGAWELNVRLAEGGVGRIETLMSIGEGTAVDRIFVRTLESGLTQWGWMREGVPEVASAPLTLSRTEPVRVRLLLGALLPPETHPWYGSGDVEQARRVSRILRIEVNGAVVVQTFRRFDRVAGGRVRVGAKSLGNMGHPRFTGEMISSQRVPLRFGDVAAVMPGVERSAEHDTIELALRFPLNRSGSRDPLIVTGATGEGDFFGVEYLDDARVRFFFDHWGSGLLTSEPLRIDFQQEHRVLVQMPWLAMKRANGIEREGVLAVAVDGGAVWRQRVRGFATDAEEIAVGENWIGGSSCGERFRGVLREVRR